MLPYGKQHISESDIEAVVQALRSDFLTTGPLVNRFEQQLCELTGAKHAVAVANGTAALHLACLAARVGPGSRGVTSPLTFLASANCMEYCGASVDFVDIDEQTLCLSPAKLQQRCEQGAVPNVVIPVDFAGVPADLAAIWALARRFGFVVIEDAAHAIGSSYTVDDTTFHCGGCNHSDMAIFSFHPVKTITTAEGGAVMTNSDELAARLRLLRSHGMTKESDVLQRVDGPWYYEMHELGYNFRITDLQCALGLSQLQRLGQFKARRGQIVARYNKAFSGDSRLLLPPMVASTNPCFHLYPLQLVDGAPSRAALFDALKGRDILCQIHYYPVHLQPYYKNKYGYAPGHCPAAERYYERCISLPLFAAMSDGDVDWVIEAVVDCMDGEGE
jgi:UDP-4-amino-4,6-dideoxy-N-acetyl-beta-L-altrosamine transaminase